MGKIAIVGEETSLSPFRTLGFSLHPVKKPQEAEEILRLICQSSDDYPIIFITEEVAEQNIDLINELDKDPLPSIVIIPGCRGKIGLAEGKMRDAMRRALGTDI